MSEIPNWPRDYYEPGGGDAFMSFMIYGQRPDDPEIPRQTFRSNGLPTGVDLRMFEAAWSENPTIEKVLSDFLDKDLPDLAVSVREQSQLTFLTGTVSDPTDLNYFRDIVGIIEWFFKAGSIAVCDITAFKWWNADQWHNDAFESNTGAPHRHVTILASELEDGLWLHTRGMIKYGRPDLSIHQVTPERMDLAVEIINRFIGAQAFGHIVEEGARIRMRAAPYGMTCHHRGSLDDPDFNNFHIEVLWPEAN